MKVLNLQAFIRLIHEYIYVDSTYEAEHLSTEQIRYLLSIEHKLFELIQANKLILQESVTEETEQKQSDELHRTALLASYKETDRVLNRLLIDIIRNLKTEMIHDGTYPNLNLDNQYALCLSELYKMIQAYLILLQKEGPKSKRELNFMRSPSHHIAKLLGVMYIPTCQSFDCMLGGLINEDGTIEGSPGNCAGKTIHWMKSCASDGTPKYPMYVYSSEYLYQRHQGFIKEFTMQRVLASRSFFTVIDSIVNQIQSPDIYYITVDNGVVGHALGVRLRNDGIYEFVDCNYYNIFPRNKDALKLEMTKLFTEYFLDFGFTNISLNRSVFAQNPEHKDYFPSKFSIMKNWTSQQKCLDENKITGYIKLITKNIIKCYLQKPEAKRQKQAVHFRECLYSNIKHMLPNITQPDICDRTIAHVRAAQAEYGHKIEPNFQLDTMIKLIESHKRHISSATFKANLAQQQHLIEHLNHALQAIEDNLCGITAAARDMAKEKNMNNPLFAHKVNRLTRLQHMIKAQLFATHQVNLSGKANVAAKLAHIDRQVVQSMKQEGIQVDQVSHIPQQLQQDMSRQTELLRTTSNLTTDDFKHLFQLATVLNKLDEILEQHLKHVKDDSPRPIQKALYKQSYQNLRHEIADIRRYVEASMVKAKQYEHTKPMLNEARMRLAKVVPLSKQQHQAIIMLDVNEPPQDILKILENQINRRVLDPSIEATMEEFQASKIHQEKNCQRLSNQAQTLLAAFQSIQDGYAYYHDNLSPQRSGISENFFKRQKYQQYIKRCDQHIEILEDCLNEINALDQAELHYQDIMRIAAILNTHYGEIISSISGETQESHLVIPVLCSKLDIPKPDEIDFNKNELSRVKSWESYYRNLIRWQRGIEVELSRMKEKPLMGKSFEVLCSNVYHNARRHALISLQKALQGQIDELPAHADLSTVDNLATIKDANFKKFPIAHLTQEGIADNNSFWQHPWSHNALIQHLDTESLPKEIQEYLIFIVAAEHLQNLHADDNRHYMALSRKSLLPFRIMMDIHEQANQLLSDLNAYTLWAYLKALHHVILSIPGVFKGTASSYDKQRIEIKRKIQDILSEHSPEIMLNQVVVFTEIDESIRRIRHAMLRQCIRQFEGQALSPQQQLRAIEGILKTQQQTLRSYDHFKLVYNDIDSFDLHTFIKMKLQLNELFGDIINNGFYVEENIEDIMLSKLKSQTQDIINDAKNYPEPSNRLELEFPHATPQMRAHIELLKLDQVYLWIGHILLNLPDDADEVEALQTVKRSIEVGSTTNMRQCYQHLLAAHINEDSHLMLKIHDLIDNKLSAFEDDQYASAMEIAQPHRPSNI